MHKKHDKTTPPSLPASHRNIKRNQQINDMTDQWRPPHTAHNSNGDGVFNVCDTTAVHNNHFSHIYFMALVSVLVYLAKGMRQLVEQKECQTTL